MDSKKIANKVMERLAGTIKTAEKDFVTKDVELEYFQDFLHTKLISKLKSEWKLTDIDKTELDWDWDKVSIKWKASFPTSSGALNVQLLCPDQEIVLSGKVTYMDDKDKDHEHRFVEKIKIEKVETEYDDVKIKNDISPSKLSKESNKLVLHF